MLVRSSALLLVRRYTVFPDIPCSRLTGLILREVLQGTATIPPSLGSRTGLLRQTRHRSRDPSLGQTPRSTRARSHLRTPLHCQAVRNFPGRIYEQNLWMPRNFLPTNPGLRPRLLNYFIIVTGPRCRYFLRSSDSRANPLAKNCRPSATVSWKWIGIGNSINRATTEQLTLLDCLAPDVGISLK
jgi:hypothetical protein